MVTKVVIHELKPVPANFDALRNVCCSVATLATLHLLRSEFISPADSKVWDRVVTEAVSHDPKPAPVNLDALVNVYCSVVTLATFHPLRSEFVSLAL